MPAEKEQKYILSFTMTPEMLTQAGWRKSSITQAYLPKNTPPAATKEGGTPTLKYTFTNERGQSVTTSVVVNDEDFEDFENHLLDETKNKAPRVRLRDGVCTLTYKFWVAEKGRDTEIESEIDKAVFDHYHAGSKRIVHKDRYAAPTNEHSDFKWTVDFLKDENSDTYIVIAEIEMPEHVNEPDYVPAVLRPHIHHIVPIEDRSFSNRKLSNIDYARKQIETIGLTKPVATKKNDNLCPLQEVA